MKDLPKSYEMMTICLNCNNVDTWTVPYGVDASGQNAVWLYNEKREQYYNLKENKYQDTASYPKCTKCGSVHLRKQYTIKDKLDEIENKLNEIESMLADVKKDVIN